MKLPALLVSTATRWTGTARIPAALADAGFSVALLTPRNSLAERATSSVGVVVRGTIQGNCTVFL